MQPLRLAITVFLIALASVCMGQDPGPGAEGSDSGSGIPEKTIIVKSKHPEAIRAKWEGSPQLPDGIVFTSTLGMAKHFNSGSPSEADQWISRGLGLDSAAARTLIDLMLVSLEQLEAKSLDRTNEILCANGTPRVFGERVHTLLDLVDDATELLAMEHLVVFKEKLDEETSDRFQQWLENRKLSIVNIRFDHKKMALAQGRTIVESDTNGTYLSFFA